MFESWYAFKLFSLVFTAIIPVINPVGSALILFGLTGPLSRKGRWVFARRVTIYSFVLLTIFFLFGRIVLEFFGVSIPVVQCAGGIVLALMGWQLLNEKEAEAKTSTDASSVAETLHLDSRVFYPYSFPLSIGPGCLAVSITLSAHIRRDSIYSVGMGDLWGLVGFFAACLVYFLCLYYMPLITQKLKTSYLVALSKILAFFVICIGAQIAWMGIQGLK